MTYTRDSGTPHRFRMSRRAGLSALTTALIATVLTGGCGQEENAPPVASVAGGSASPAPASVDADRQAAQYRDCLLRTGVKLLDHPTSEGLPQVDKQRTPSEKLSAAQEKCREFLPTGGAVVKPDPQYVEAQRRQAECVRQHGVPEYPDPDPVTGNPRVSDELAARLKGDSRLGDALRACQSSQAPGGSGAVNG